VETQATRPLTPVMLLLPLLLRTLALTLARTLVRVHRLLLMSPRRMKGRDRGIDLGHRVPPALGRRRRRATTRFVVGALQCTLKETPFFSLLVLLEHLVD
jgi:hypothetical protein